MIVLLHCVECTAKSMGRTSSLNLIKVLILATTVEAVLSHYILHGHSDWVQWLTSPDDEGLLSQQRSLIRHQSFQTHHDGVNEPYGTCPKFKRRKDFLIIGHSGGDPIGHCENTLDATRSALAMGANAIEIDLALTADNVIFLWHDPYPLGAHALARRLGFTLSGKCRPSMASNKASVELTWSQIQQHWYYDDLSNSGKKSDNVIPSLDEWMAEFAENTQIGLIWLDVKLKFSWEITAFVKTLVRILERYNVKGRIQLSAHEEAVGRSLQRELIRLGHHDLANHVVADTVSFLPYLGHQQMASYDAISKAMGMTAFPTKAGNESDYKEEDISMVCGCCANIGQPPLATDKWRGLQRMVKFNLARRNLLERATQSHLHIYVWTIDVPSQMKWLYYTGVDGIITNRPKIMADIVRSATNTFKNNNNNNNNNRPRLISY